MNVRMRSLLVLASLAAALCLPGTARAQSSYFCLLYPFYDDGTSYLYYSNNYLQSCEDDSSMGDGYVWYGVVEDCPQSCAEGNCIESSDNTAPQGTALRGADQPFPELLPSSYHIGNKADRSTVNAGIGSLSTPAEGIDAQSLGFVFVTAASGLTIPVKLFVVNLDFKSAGVPADKYPKGHQYKTLYLGIEVSNDGGVNPASALQAIQQPFKNYSGKIEVKSANRDEFMLFNVLTRTRMN